MVGRADWRHALWPEARPAGWQDGTNDAAGPTGRDRGGCSMGHAPVPCCAVGPRPRAACAHGRSCRAGAVTGLLPVAMTGGRTPRGRNQSPFVHAACAANNLNRSGYRPWIMTTRHVRHRLNHATVIYRPEEFHILSYSPNRVRSFL